MIDTVIECCYVERKIYACFQIDNTCHLSTHKNWKVQYIQRVQIFPPTFSKYKWHQSVHGDGVRSHIKQFHHFTQAIPQVKTCSKGHCYIWHCTTDHTIPTVLKYRCVSSVLMLFRYLRRADLVNMVYVLYDHDNTYRFNQQSLYFNRIDDNNWDRVFSSFLGEIYHVLWIVFFTFFRGIRSAYSNPYIYHWHIVLTTWIDLQMHFCFTRH